MTISAFRASWWKAEDWNPVRKAERGPASGTRRRERGQTKEEAADGNSSFQ
ncbi:MAG: hypothetical protein IIW01_04380 [Thermoguttaceae bacterium]|nr:hypothetical protein [Thermoguttaceae bacterium]